MGAGCVTLLPATHGVLASAPRMPANAVVAKWTISTVVDKRSPIQVSEVQISRSAREAWYSKEIMRTKSSCAYYVYVHTYICIDAILLEIPQLLPRYDSMACS